MKRDWTPEEDNKLKTLSLNSKLSYVKIGEILGRSGQGCNIRARKLGLNHNHKFRKYEVNESFWSSKPVKLLLGRNECG